MASIIPDRIRQFNKAWSSTNEDLGIIGAVNSIKDYVPALTSYIPANICCAPVADATEDMDAMYDDVSFFSRTSASLATIFGIEILNKICEIGCAEAEKALDLGTDHIIQSNWGLVYTDVQGNFRVRLALMTKDPAGKTGWHVSVHEVIVNPVEGDMFTCAEISLYSFSNSTMFLL